MRFILQITLVALPLVASSTYEEPPIDIDYGYPDGPSDDGFEGDISTDSNLYKQAEKMSCPKKRVRYGFPVATGLDNAPTAWFPSHVVFMDDDANVDTCAALCYLAEEHKKGKCRAAGFHAMDNACQLYIDGSEGDYEFIEDEGHGVETFLTDINCSDSKPGDVDITPEEPPVHKTCDEKVEDCNCGHHHFVNSKVYASEPNKLQKRGVNGLPMEANAWPWLVGVQFDMNIFKKRGETKDNNEPSWATGCGGSLVSLGNGLGESDIVISAQHCFDNMTDPVRDIRIACGDHSKTKLEKEEFVRVVKNIVPSYSNSYIVPGENTRMTSGIADIAILKLEKPVRFTEKVQPICLPSNKNTVPDKTWMVVAGWGRLSKWGRAPDIPHEVRVSKIPDTICTQKYEKSRISSINITAEFCAGWVYKNITHDSCTGDSGGPLMSMDKETKRWQLDGIVSWGEGCANPDYPGVYTRMTTFMPWVKETICEISEFRDKIEWCKKDRFW